MVHHVTLGTSWYIMLLQVHNGGAEEGRRVWNHGGRRLRDPTGHQQIQVTDNRTDDDGMKNRNKWTNFKSVFKTCNISSPFAFNLEFWLLLLLHSGLARLIPLNPFYLLTTHQQQCAVQKLTGALVSSFHLRVSPNIGHTTYKSPVSVFLPFKMLKKHSIYSYFSLHFVYTTLKIAHTKELKCFIRVLFCFQI